MGGPNPQFSRWLNPNFTKSLEVNCKSNLIQEVKYPPINKLDQSSLILHTFHTFLWFKTYTFQPLWLNIHKVVPSVGPPDIYTCTGRNRLATTQNIIYQTQNMQYTLANYT